MIVNSKSAENAYALRVAEGMISAARTAPKTKGIDRIKSVILTAEDSQILADIMEKMGEEKQLDFFLRDAKNVRQSQCVVVVAVSDEPSGLNENCQRCGRENCAEAVKDQVSCAFASVDLGIAVGSAVSYASMMRVDTRVMFSAGKAAATMNLFSKPLKNVLAIPVSISGKSPFFDRAKV